MSRSPLVALLLVLSLALGLRLVAHPRMAAQADSFAPIIDAEAYTLQALRIARGEPIVDGVTFQAPLYAWVLGWTYRAAGVGAERSGELTGEPDPDTRGEPGLQRLAELDADTRTRALAVGRALQAALGVLTAVLALFAGRALFGPGAGLAAGLLAACYGPLLAYEGHLLKVGLSGVFPLAALLAACAALRRPRVWLWALCGAFLGAGGLVRGNLYLLAWVGGAALLFAGLRSGAWRRGLREAGALALGVALVLAPVIVRNSSVAGRPVVSTAAGGTAFWLCNHAGNTTGMIQHVPENRQVPRYELDDWTRLTEAELGHAVTPAQVSRHWFGKALRDILADPARWLLTEARKLGLLFSRYEAPDNTSVRLAEEAVPLLGWLPGWVLVQPLALVGLFLALRRRLRGPGLAALGLALGTYAASLLLFIVTARFRMPLCVLALLPAGYALAELPALVRAGRLVERVLVGAMLLLGLGLSRASEGPLGPLSEAELASHHVVRLANRAQVALARGELGAARVDLEDALALGASVRRGSPTVFAGLAGLDRADALAAAKAGELPRAEELLAQAEAGVQLALKVSPGHLDALALRVVLLLDRGREEEASAALSDYDRQARAHGRTRDDDPPEFAPLRAK